MRQQRDVEVVDGCVPGSVEPVAGPGSVEQGVGQSGDSFRNLAVVGLDGVDGVCIFCGSGRRSWPALFVKRRSPRRG